MTSAIVEVAGETVSDAVVTVNGEPVDVDADGVFSHAAALEEGINIIEIAASDFAENVSEEVRTIIYAP